MAKHPKRYGWGGRGRKVKVSAESPPSKPPTDAAPPPARPRHTSWRDHMDTEQSTSLQKAPIPLSQQRPPQAEQHYFAFLGNTTGSAQFAYGCELPYDTLLSDGFWDPVRTSGLVRGSTIRVLCDNAHELVVGELVVTFVSKRHTDNGKVYVEELWAKRIPRPTAGEAEVGATGAQVETAAAGAKVKTAAIGAQVDTAAGAKVDTAAGAKVDTAAGAKVDTAAGVKEKAA